MAPVSKPSLVTSSTRWSSPAWGRVSREQSPRQTDQVRAATPGAPVDGVRELHPDGVGRLRSSRV